jgi:3-hydroxyisobutyrate dehydrogenase
MAANLAKKGFSVVALDVSEAAVNKLKSAHQNVTGARTPKEVAAKAKYIVTMLPSSPHVQSVYAGADGIFESIQSGSLLIDSSTIDPLVAREVATKAKQHKSDFVDAPVSGGVGGAEQGTLTFMVGGEKDVFERSKLVLEAMGKNIVHCGGSGNGQVVKLCNNLALAIEMIGISEAMNLGVSLGMDAKVLAGIFNTSTARCWSSDTYNPVPGVMPNVPSSRGYTGGFGVDLMAKDLGLAVGAATQIKAPLPLGGQALQIYNLLSANGGGGKDFSSVFEFLQKKSQK